MHCLDWYLQRANRPPFLRKSQTRQRVNVSLRITSVRCITHIVADSSNDAPTADAPAPPPEPRHPGAAPEADAESAWQGSKRALVDRVVGLLNSFFEDRDPVARAEDARHRAAAAALERAQREARTHAAEAARWREELGASKASIEALRAEKAREDEAREMVAALRREEGERQAKMAQELMDRIAKMHSEMGDLRAENARVHSDFSKLYTVNVKKQEAYEELEARCARAEEAASSSLYQVQLCHAEIVRLGGRPPVSAQHTQANDNDAS